MSLRSQPVPHFFQRFYLDQEKDIIVDLYETGDKDALFYRLRTPNHHSGNLITNLAGLCALPLSFDDQGLKIIEGEIPAYIDAYNRTIYIFRLGDTKVANIFPDGTVEMKAHVPAIAKTLMSQTKDYRLGLKRTIVKSFILQKCKFRADLHTHMNANLHPDILIALGLKHQIRYPLYYIKKLSLRMSEAQEEEVLAQRASVEKDFADSPLTGKYLTRKIDDNTFLNFADFILNNPAHAEENIAKIRASLTILKDGQAVFTNLEKVYLYRYVFTKGLPSETKIPLDRDIVLHAALPDRDIRDYLLRMLEDLSHPVYAGNSLFQDKLLWIARASEAQGIRYLEISDTTLVKAEGAAGMLSEVHRVMPAIYRESGVMIRFLAGIRRIALTIVKDSIVSGDYFRENLQVLEGIARDPYVAGADIIGEEINDIRELKPVIKELVRIAQVDPDFVLRIHAGDNDSLRENVAHAISCVKDSLEKGQQMPRVRIGHGLYTPDLRTLHGKTLVRDMIESGVVVEFQITSNVRLNNLTTLDKHPLRAYLKQGVRCVQGTDGGAIYGTGSIDEQLSLEKMLNLSTEELYRMRRAEETVIRQAMRSYRSKKDALKKENITDYDSYYTEKIRAARKDDTLSFLGKDKFSPDEVLSDRIRELPSDAMPVVTVGGSFNNDTRKTLTRPAEKQLIDTLLHEADPAKVFFVIGHTLTGYERYLVERNRSRHQGRFRIFAMVPSMISAQEEKRLRASGVWIRVSIESSPMGLYKSFAYEIFKRRIAVLLALDGNSAGANMIQEAKNTKHPVRIYVSAHSKILKAKAGTIEGYVTLFSRAEEVLPWILKDLRIPGEKTESY
ncbi:MAG: adenosine deaminase [Lachnospiraceae bacterium]|nr:adenosine deaminase [Lachnospiraceae bacterium]